MKKRDRERHMRSAHACKKEMMKQNTKWGKQFPKFWNINPSKESEKAIGKRSKLKESFNLKMIFSTSIAHQEREVRWAIICFYAHSFVLDDPMIGKKRVLDKIVQEDKEQKRWPTFVMKGVKW